MCSLLECVDSGAIPAHSIKVPCVRRGSLLAFRLLDSRETQHGPIHGWLPVRQRPNCGVGPPLPGRPLSLSRLSQASWRPFPRFRGVPSGCSDDRRRNTRVRRAVFLPPRCGSSIFARTADEIEVNPESLDAPDQLMPTYESWIVRRESWLPAFPLKRRYERDRDASGRFEEGGRTNGAKAPLRRDQSEPGPELRAKNRVLSSSAPRCLSKMPMSIDTSPGGRTPGRPRAGPRDRGADPLGPQPRDHGRRDRPVRAVVQGGPGPIPSTSWKSRWSYPSATASR